MVALERTVSTKVAYEHGVYVGRFAGFMSGSHERCRAVVSGVASLEGVLCAQRWPGGVV